MLANTTLRNKIHCSQDVHNICWRKRCSVLCDHAATLTTVTPRRVTGRATRSRQTTVTNSLVLAFTLHTRTRIAPTTRHPPQTTSRARARAHGVRAERRHAHTHVHRVMNTRFVWIEIRLITNTRHERRKMPPRLRNPTVMLTDRRGRCCNAFVV